MQKKFNADMTNPDNDPPLDAQTREALLKCLKREGVRHPIGIYGITAKDGIPTFHLLRWTKNEEHVNLIELARAQWHLSAQTGQTFRNIVLIAGGDEVRTYQFP